MLEDYRHVNTDFERTCIIIINILERMFPALVCSLTLLFRTYFTSMFSLRSALTLLFSSTS
jgi:hypothetical protein